MLQLTDDLQSIVNAYCATGEGGGHDNSCSSRSSEPDGKHDDEPQSGGTGKKGDPIRVDRSVDRSVDRAVKELLRGNFVHVRDKQTATKVLDRMREMILSDDGPTDNESFFATCDRDDKGHCLPGDGGGASGGSGKPEWPGNDATDAQAEKFRADTHAYAQKRLKELEGGDPNDEAWAKEKEEMESALHETDPKNWYGDAPSEPKIVGEVDGQPVTAPPPASPGEPVLEPKVFHDENGDGVTDIARVGVPAMEVPPPPPIPRLPNLTPEEREVERGFIDFYQKDPDAVAGQFLEVVNKTTAPGEPPTFGTDDAKCLSDVWVHPEVNQRLENRSRLNAALHQTANAICKRAFLQHLDTLKPGDEIMVTVGGCGCHVADTPIMMSDGGLKMVQDVEVGDELMGPDSQPRRVLKLIRGVGKLYDVVPKKGKPFRVNGDHVLSLITNRGPGTQKRTKRIRIEMTVNEYLSKSSSFQRSCLLHRTGVDFPHQEVKLDPYYLGIWLGNGARGVPSITSQDSEVSGFIQEYAESLPGTRLVVRDKTPYGDQVENNAKDYRISLQVAGRPKVRNPVTQMLQDLGVLHSKHLPAAYLRNDRHTRLRLLAGLIDTDGSYGHGMFEFSTKCDRMAYDVTYLARSLGFAAYAKSRMIQTNFLDAPREYWRVSISGDIDQIPTLVARKKASPRQINKDALRVGFSIVPAGEGEYFGFTLEGDGLYLLDDFTVTHNSGKGYSLGKGEDGQPFVPVAFEAKQRSKAVWDSAGDQNANENPWIQKEAEARGLKVNYVYVHADPENQWANPQMGVIARAAKPKDGRMVDADVFADSYAIGAKNHAAFAEQHKDNPNASFMYIQNGKTPKQLSGVPQSALALDRDQLASFAKKAVKEADVPERVKVGGTVGERIWKDAPVKNSYHDTLLLWNAHTNAVGVETDLELDMIEDYSDEDMEAWARGMEAADEEEFKRQDRILHVVEAFGLGMLGQKRQAEEGEQGSDPTENVNVEGCNQHTGPNCAGTTGEKVTVRGERLEPATRGEDKVWRGADGKPLPEHIQKVGIPPGWKDVFANPDPDGDILATGIDAKGRVQAKYSASHNARAAAAKFGRVTELRQKRAGIFKELEQDAKDPELKDRAECLRLVMQTGMRPGSDGDTKADHKSYGATTLQGRHVKIGKNGDVYLRLVTGKNKGREVSFPIRDKATAEMLKRRAAEVGSKGRMFNVSAEELRQYSKTKDGGGFKTKDHRTALGTETAFAAIKSQPTPTTPKEYKQAVKDVATQVAKTLGNTPSVALKSYIDPVVFAGWKKKAGIR